MPRVRASDAQASAQAPRLNVPIRVPLNDDREEKAKRLQSRQAYHEAQMNSIKAAASPARKRKSLLAPNDAPHTPSQGQDDVDMHVMGAAVTPMKRVPLLANFEEWMKMATDNKINATNSWNFALIDYFHDMSLLKEGDGVNFQKASCTLDGCVKIYTSRVDSVATETGKLLSGLADSGNKKSKDGDADDPGDGDDDDEEGAKKAAKKKTQRTHEATLATSFAQLQVKKLELEFAVDPLFKKASADFDQGGAKGLLLNHLCIDSTGRIVFDSSDDAQQPADDDTRRDSMLHSKQADNDSSDQAQQVKNDDMPVDVAALGARFFPDLSKLDTQDICPSLKTFELGSGSASLDLPFLKSSDDWKKDIPQDDDDDDDDARSGIVIDEDNADGFDDVMGGFDMPADAGFGQGGEIWAREANIQPQAIPFDMTGEKPDEPAAESGPVGAFHASSKQYAVTLVHREKDQHENILSYFDDALKKNWAGPEHWKIQKVKNAARAPVAPVKRKEKEPFEIDFVTPMTQQLADLLYTKASSNSTINLPKSQWKSRTRNLLPDDKHFNSRDLLTLFLKPKARIGSRRSGMTPSTTRPELPEGQVDEAYWAQAQNQPSSHDNDPNAVAGAYDADFFQDDGAPFAPADDIDDDDFADAQELLPPSDDQNAALNVPASQQGAFGSQLVMQSRRARPEYVQYARVAKKVDVRRLKEEMWRGIGFEQSNDASALADPENPNANSPRTSLAPQDPKATPQDELKFTDVVNNLRKVYPQQQMPDISTSYCFICLLHLANEKGLTITNTADFEELSIRRDHTAEITGEA